MLKLGKGKRRTREAIATAGELAADGEHLRALEVLTEANRERSDPDLEHLLVRARNRAFASLPVDRRPTPEPDPSGLELREGLPNVPAPQLTAGRLRHAISEHGALVVRGLVPDESRLAELRDGVDRAFDARERAGDDSEDPWYRQFEPEPEYELAVGFGRQFVNAGSGVWLADSPRMLFQLTEAFERAGLRELISDYLGERPAISVNKGTLRRAAPDVASGWHQDGAFLGDGIRSINVWLALNDCGRDAPGMEIVAKRLDRIVETGTHDAQFEWSVGEAVVADVADGALATPEFKAGDALLFDHFNLHRTGLDPSMTRTRYATETWFFAPSAYPDRNDQVPLAF